MAENTELRAKVVECAIENYKSGLNCAESVVDALIRAGALDADPAIRAMAGGFGGGIGLSGNTCGALSGAVMANGARYGRKDPWSVDPEVRGKENSEKYYRRYNQMVRDFAAANGGVTCREISSKHEDWHSKDRRKMCMLLIAETAGLAYDYLQIPNEEAFQIPYQKDNMGGMA